MNRAVFVGTCLVLSVCGQLTSAGQTTPGQPATGSISGTVTSGDVGQPVRKAQVRIVSTTKQARTTTTDADGRYVFTDLPAGSYTLSASKPGYVDMVRGARRPGPTSQGTLVTLAAGQKIESVSWTLPRAGVITGTVLDEYGDPAFNVPVRAMRFVFPDGHRSLTSGGNAVTDDRGIYRIPGLTAGEYLVAAVPRDNVADTAARAEFTRDRQAEVMAAAKAAGRPPNVASPPPLPDPVGYVPVYYPGTPLGASAATVRVGVSEEVAGIDIRLELVRTVSVTGRIASAEGSLPQSRLQLIDASMPLSLVGIWFRDMRPDGSFGFQGVVPGSYLVKAHGTPGGKPGMAGGEMWASVDLAVDTRGASDVTLTMQRGVRIAGQIVFDNLPAGFDRSRLRVSLHPVSGPADWEMPIIPVTPDAEGRFTVQNVLPGRLRPVVTGLPDGWSLASALFGDRDAADYHLTVDGSRNLTGELRFTSRTGKIAGTIADAKGAAAPDYTVILFPDDRALWLPASRRIVLAQPGPDGRYVFGGLPPGEYRLGAVLDPEPGRQFDPEYLTQLLAVSVAVTLGEGESRTQDLKIRLP